MFNRLQCNVYLLWFSAPKPASNLECTPTTDELDLSWDEPDGSYGYVIVSIGTSTTVRVDEGGTREAIFRNLASGTLFSVSVVTYSGDRTSIALQQSFYTSKF